MLYYVIGMSIKKALELKLNQELERVFESNTGRPTALSATIITLPKLEDNPISGQDYYCKILLDNTVNTCRLTFDDIWKSLCCSFCGWQDREHSPGCPYDPQN